MSVYGNRYSRADVVGLYGDGWTVAEIVDELGCTRMTVYRHLDAAGVERRDDRATAPHPRRTHCARRGHEFTEANTRVDVNGTRHCRRCEQLRRMGRMILAAAAS